MTIPNRLNTIVALTSVPVAAAAGLGAGDLGFHLLAAAAVLCIGFAMFALNIIGGGDAKFAAAIALWLDPAVLLQWVVWASIYGGLLTVFILFFRVLPVSSQVAGWDWLARLHDRKTGVPYGVALAAAGFHLYPSTSIFIGLGGWPALQAYMPH
jgi:prepilin peptidase CpaA